MGVWGDEWRLNGGMADSKGRNMAPVEPNPPLSEMPRARWRGRVLWLGGLLCLGVLASVGLKAQQERAIELAKRENALQTGAMKAHVVRHLRTCELVTSRVETIVRAQNNDDNWFGSVVATVEAPARLSYGVDLSKLESSRVVFSPIGGVYSLRVPAPKRIATEVFTGKEKTDVALAGLRFRSLAGEEQLGIARARLHEQALRLRITGAESDRIRESARAEIAGLVKRIVGEGASVRVWFEDEEGWRTTMATGE